MVDTAATEPAAILVVDDTESARELLAERLGELGHLIFLAESGPAALDLIEKQNFDAVILDVMMPGMNGLEVLRRVRETRGITELPIIMATALGDRQDVVTALRAGANDFLTKPLDYHIVVARLETQLRLKRANDQILRLNRQLRQAQEQIARLAESSAEAMRDTRTWGPRLRL